jgi:hypothetical protein
LAISGEVPRGEALIVLAPQLDGALLQQALGAALAISEEEARASALAALAPRLNGVLIQQALDAALAISEEEARVKALVALAPQLPEPLLQQSVEAARAIKDEKRRAVVLMNFLPLVLNQIALVKNIRHALRCYLRAIKNRQRQDVLAFCGNTALFTAPVLNSDTLVGKIKFRVGFPSSSVLDFFQVLCWLG